MRLEKLVESVISLHTDTLEAKHPEIKIPVQTSIAGVYPTPSQRSFMMGRFYEVVNRAIYGGKLNDIKFDIEFGNGYLGEDSIKPDVIDKDIIWEAKACCSGHSCNIMNRQLEGYQFLQYTSPDKQVLFSLYRHTLRGIKKEERSQEEIIEELSKKTLFSVVLPLRIILKLQEHPIVDGISLARLYDGGKEWSPCLCVGSRTINRFLEYPEQNLEYLGLDPKTFEIRRFLSPSRLRINRRKVKQFPIVKIFDLDHSLWVEEFVRNYEEDMEKLDVEPDEVSFLPLEDENIPF